MSRSLYRSGALWEEIVGYSRAVRVGNVVEFSGTTSVDKEGRVVGENDFYEQTRYVYQKIEGYLSDIDFSMKDVVRCRIFVVDISRWQDVGRAHHGYFGTIKPALSMVEVSALIDPRLLVEIEVTAIKE